MKNEYALNGTMLQSTHALERHRFFSFIIWFFIVVFLLGLLFLGKHIHTIGLTIEQGVTLPDNDIISTQHVGSDETL
jgi:hypothetical protein